jgi:integrase
MMLWTPPLPARECHGYSKPSTHPLRGDEVRALRELRRQCPDSAFIFAIERGGPFTPDAVNRLIKRIGERARFAFLVHAHMLRHACGYALANAGHDTRRIQDWLGHRLIQHTTRYTQSERGAVQGLLEMMTGSFPRIQSGAVLKPGGKK